MSMWKKAMDYLGLGPDDAYDDYDVAPEPERPVACRASAARRAAASARVATHTSTSPRAPVRTRAQHGPASRSATSTVRSAGRCRPTDDSNVQPRPINPRPAPAARAAAVGAGAEPHTVRPRRFDSAQEVADKFKEGQPVIMNLEAADREVVAAPHRLRQRPLLRPQRHAWRRSPPACTC